MQENPQFKWVTENLDGNADYSQMLFKETDLIFLYISMGI